MTIRYINPPGAKIEEGWQQDAEHFCPQCGAQGVWLLESSGTFYNNDIGFCTHCDTAWEWTYFDEEWTNPRGLLLRKKFKGIANA